MYIYFGVASIALIGYFKRHSIKTTIINQSWNIVYYYHLSKTYISNTLFNINETEEKEVEEKKENLFICYDGEKEMTFTSEILKEKGRCCDNYKLLYYYNHHHMKELKQKKYLSFYAGGIIMEPSDDFFMNIEFVQNNKHINIKNHLYSFLVVGNRLFTKDFLKWYLKRYYGVELEDEYEVNIMDNNINYLNLKNSTQYIEITSKNKYNIINI